MKKTMLLLAAFSFFFLHLQAQTEPDAGNWPTWFISSGRDFRLSPPPNAATTAAELKTLQAVQKNNNAATEQKILYWNTGAPSFRWRKILSVIMQSDTAQPGSLVGALFNLAVYDATITAWDTKYAYHRKRPFVHSQTVKTFIPKPESPSYPCEASVAAGVAYAMVSHFYPAKKDSVRQLAEEAMQARVAAGVQYPSDTKAGFELGQKIAEQVIAKGKAYIQTAQWDGKMPGEPGLWRGTNPIGAMWGARKPFVLTSGSQLRPPPPPDYQKEMEELKAFKQTFRSVANAFFYAGQTYWIGLAEQKIFEYNLHLNPPRVARLYALRSAAAYDTQVACWDAKYAYWGTRPDQYDTTYRPILMGTPNFPGYPSGHAAMAGSSAVILAEFFPAEKEFFWQKAKEAAEARFEGGVHFRTDNEVGLEMGKKVAELVLQKIKATGVEKKQSLVKSK